MNLGIQVLINPMGVLVDLLVVSDFLLLLRVTKQMNWEEHAPILVNEVQEAVNLIRDRNDPDTSGRSALCRSESMPFSYALLCNPTS